MAVALLVLSQTKHDNWFVTATTGVIVFFTSAMVAHRTLYEARPAARHLTEFYLWMSFGGALGGLSAALIAPKIFSEVFEYPLLLALSMACRPGVFSAAALRRVVGQHRHRVWRLRPLRPRPGHARDDRGRQAGGAGAVADRRRRHPGDLLAALGDRQAPLQSRRMGHHGRSWRAC